MLTLPPTVRVFLCLAPADMRRSLDGLAARNAAILFSVVVSCKLIGVDPFAYLKDVLARISTHPADRMHELIPREWKKRFASQASPATSAAA